MGEMKPNLEYVEQTSMSNDKGGKVSVVKIRFNVFPVVSESIYHYINDNSSEKQIQITDNNTIEDVVFIDKIRTIPLYNFYAAAGSFSELQSDNEFTLIDAPEYIKNPEDYFACQVIGESMNKVIPNGAIGLFKYYQGGSRNNKIVLVEHRDIQDEDFNSAFTVKTYSSEKIVTEEGWNHTRITLLPNSFDTSYLPILITEEEAENMKIIGEFVAIIN